MTLYIAASERLLTGFGIRRGSTTGIVCQTYDHAIKVGVMAAIHLEEDRHLVDRIFAAIAPYSAYYSPEDRHKGISGFILPAHGEKVLPAIRAVMPDFHVLEVMEAEWLGVENVRKDVHIEVEAYKRRTAARPKPTTSVGRVKEKEFAVIQLNSYGAPKYRRPESGALPKGWLLIDGQYYGPGIDGASIYELSDAIRLANEDETVVKLPSLSNLVKGE